MATWISPPSAIDLPKMVPPKHARHRCTRIGPQLLRLRDCLQEAKMSEEEAGVGDRLCKEIVGGGDGAS